MHQHTFLALSPLHFHWLSCVKIGDYHVKHVYVCALKSMYINFLSQVHGLHLQFAFTQWKRISCTITEHLVLSRDRPLALSRASVNDKGHIILISLPSPHPPLRVTAFEYSSSINDYFSNNENLREKRTILL